jgi:hypothetical protein
VESERLHVFSVIVPRHPALASRSRRGGLVETELRPRVSHLVPVLAAVSTERISAQQERLQSSSSSPILSMQPRYEPAIAHSCSRSRIARDQVRIAV